MDNKAKPILFSTPMVQAILEGRKTMTRRVVKNQDGIHPRWNTIGWLGWDDGHGYKMRQSYDVGDVLWVRETWREYCVRRQSDSKNHYCYKADHERGYVCFNGSCDLRWRPSIFMPKEAARIFLRVTDVRVERVQDILCGDMQREGCIPKKVTGGQWQQWQHDYWIPLWDSINAKRGYGWDTNPWVFVYSFERIDKPVDM
jgi:hypothetical protein